jgi:chlorobactene glucosyltransferase
MTTFLFALPWLGILLFVRFVARVPSELPTATRGTGLPSVSVIVPARNEELNIENCLASLTASEYPDFEVIVVDDRSEDRTAELARAVSSGNARRVSVVEGAELPEGWLGKPWACHQGFGVAEGDMLLFTEADTAHGTNLLNRAVAGHQAGGADLLTVGGRQLMETFWGKLVQPQVFLVMLFRVPGFERIARNDRWRDAFANGQYLLFSREAYKEIGGHVAVREEVVEDLVLGQRVKRAGLRLRIRSSELDFATRMYRSLADIIEGWSKNLLIGGLQSLPPFLRGVAVPFSLLESGAIWIVPPIVAVIALLRLGSDVSGGLLAWSGVIVALSVATWAMFSRQMRVPAMYGLFYPLGAGVGAYIFARSWVRGRDVEWKGRHYRVPPLSP